MKKRGEIKIFIILAILIVVVLIVWQLVTLPINKRNAELNQEENESANLTQSQTQEEANETIPEETPEINQTEVNQTEANQTANATEESSNDVLLPPEKITAIDRRDEQLGRYYCDDDEDPKHKVRVYSYKIIDGVKTLSENYTESKEVDVCDTYSINESKEGIYYYIEWTWKAVEGRDGYRIFQYYHAENVSRNYDYFVDIKTERLIDSKLGLWISNSSA